MALTWRNVNAPNYNAAVAAQRTGANLLSNIGGNTRDFLKSNEIRNRLMEDRGIAAEQRDFDRADALLSRQQTQQAIDKNQFGLYTQQQTFDTSEKAKQAQIIARNQQTATQALQSKLLREQASREAKDRSDYQAAFNQKLALGDDIFDTEDARTQDQNILKSRNASPETALKLLKLEDILAAPSAAKISSDTFAEKLRLETRADTKSNKELQNKLDVASIKKKGTNPYKIADNILEQMDPDDQIEAQNIANSLFKGSGMYQSGVGKIKKYVSPEDFLTLLSGDVSNKYKNILPSWGKPDVNAKDLLKDFK